MEDHIYKEIILFSKSKANTQKKIMAKETSMTMLQTQALNSDYYVQQMKRRLLNMINSKH